jgi:nicotinamide riboside kinase
MAYTGQVKKFINKERLGNRNDYNSVSIIGAQSSGKSTLLNLLFDTEFDALKMEETGN